MVQNDKRCTIQVIKIKRFMVFTARFALSPYIKQANFIFKGLKPSGHYIYHQFNIHKYEVLPTQYIYVFCFDPRTNSDYFPIQH